MFSRLFRTVGARFAAGGIASSSGSDLSPSAAGNSYSILAEKMHGDRVFEELGAKLKTAKTHEERVKILSEYRGIGDALLAMDLPGQKKYLDSIKRSVRRIIDFPLHQHDQGVQHGLLKGLPPHILGSVAETIMVNSEGISPFILKEIREAVERMSDQEIDAYDVYVFLTARYVISPDGALRQVIGFHIEVCLVDKKNLGKSILMTSAIDLYDTASPEFQEVLANVLPARKVENPSKIEVDNALYRAMTWDDDRAKPNVIISKQLENEAASFNGQASTLMGQPGTNPYQAEMVLKINVSRKTVREMLVVDRVVNHIEEKGYVASYGPHMTTRSCGNFSHHLVRGCEQDLSNVGMSALTSDLIGMAEEVNVVASDGVSIFAAIKQALDGDLQKVSNAEAIQLVQQFLASEALEVPKSPDRLYYNLQYDTFSKKSDKPGVEETAVEGTKIIDNDLKNTENMLYAPIADEKRNEMTSKPSDPRAKTKP